MNPIETSRLLLREFEKEDAQHLYGMSQDLEAQQFVGGGELGPPLGDWENWIRELRMPEIPKRNPLGIAIVLRDSRQFVGKCGLWIDRKSRSGELGYEIKRSYWGNGYATEAAKSFVDFAFGHLQLHRIWAGCRPAHKASVRVLEKIGMTYEGHFREASWSNDKWIDTVYYAVLEQEWQG